MPGTKPWSLGPHYQGSKWAGRCGGGSSVKWEQGHELRESREGSVGGLGREERYEIAI